ncbi:G2/mitotic-specific cyclin-B-like [Rhopilema esculentum]|uniref:G2/mitotic-specific cyclin-B-like n=1 Tax=Rhopilema esculentum TaxID=499914 RepID=UPI0031D26424|eukprot:gene6480-11933_t
MEAARRIRNNMDYDFKRGSTKPGIKQTKGTTRTALGDIRNVAKERNFDVKAQQRNKKVETQKLLSRDAGKENENTDLMVKRGKAMSICETLPEKEAKIEEATKKNHLGKTEEENVEKGNVGEVLGHCRAMSVCESDPVILGVRSMSICETIPPNIIDIDKESEKDPFQCAEYAADIYTYLRKIEKVLCAGDYMQKQSEINERMRSILIDWLVQVHSRFGLLQETLYLTVGIIDRFLEHQVVSRSKLQLVGVSAMLLASKYEETYAPEIGDFVYITDNSYTKGNIKKMEQLILRTLDCDLSQPLCLQFLRRNSKAAVADAKKHTLAKYLMELTLVDYKLSRMPPSIIAAASLYLAGKVLENAEWTDTLVYYSTYTEQSLMPVVKSIAKLIAKADVSKFQASRTKYGNNKFMGISQISELKGDLIFKLSQD